MWGLFSRMSPDQVREQNDNIIKRVSGATRLLNRADHSTFEQWESSALERDNRKFPCTFCFKKSDKGELKNFVDLYSNEKIMIFVTEMKIPFN